MVHVRSSQGWSSYHMDWVQVQERPDDETDARGREPPSSAELSCVSIDARPLMRSTLEMLCIIPRRHTAEGGAQVCVCVCGVEPRYAIWMPRPRRGGAWYSA